MKASQDQRIARRIQRSTSAGLALISLLCPMTAFAHPPGITERVSVDSDGNQGNDRSGFLSGPAISAGGRFVAFDSTATDLIPGGNLSFGIFVHDRRSGTTELVSVSSGRNQGEGLSSSPAISADGRFVAFDSDASNLVHADRNDITDVFVHDRVTGETIRVSVSTAGEEGASSSHAPAISCSTVTAIRSGPSARLTLPPPSAGPLAVQARTLSSVQFATTPPEMPLEPPTCSKLPPATCSRPSSIPTLPRISRLTKTTSAGL